MKLINLQIDGAYKSLTNFSYDFKSLDYDYDPVEPICFVGLNGSGKSNIIEALSEVFCYLELYGLGYGPVWARVAPLSFDLSYSLRVKGGEKLVQVSAVQGKHPELKVASEKVDITSNEVILQWLPDRIIGYTSGDNETISFPYMRNQGFYANEILKMAQLESIGGEVGQVQHTRTLFMDYEVNSLILLANYLFYTSRELKIFNEFLRIKGVASFRIVISLSKKGRKSVEITSEIKDIIERLRLCALVSDYHESEQAWVLDFVLNGATRRAFKYYFDNAEVLFTSLYKLNLLNNIRLTGKERAFYTAKPKKNTLIEKPPVVPKEDRVFAVDQLKLNIDSPEREIDYVGISDGEHQFIHIVGTVMLFSERNALYLFDEPESHFNPNWRSKFIDTISSQVSSSNPEFMLSTHSPYVVSACKTHNVVNFVREGSVVKVKEPSINTFGATFDDLLKELFDIKSSIARYSSEQLNKLLREKDLDKLRLAIGDYGESPEKRRLYEAVIRLEEEAKKG